MNQKRRNLTLIVGSLITLALLSNTSLAGQKLNKPKVDCQAAVNSSSTDDSSDFDIGPDDVSDGPQRNTSLGVDDPGNEFSSRDGSNNQGGGNNWDGGGGAGGPWSSDF